jgi:hypothetical protein
LCYFTSIYSEIRRFSQMRISPTCGLQFFSNDQRMSIDSRRDLTELTNSIYYCGKSLSNRPIRAYFKNLRQDFESYAESRPSSWCTNEWLIFSLRLFEQCRGFECADENVGEVRIIVSMDEPSASYQPDRTCIICGEQQQGDLFPQRKSTSTCHHDPDVCLECLQGWLR